MPLARRGAGLGGYRSSAMLQKRYILIGVYIYIYIHVYILQTEKQGSFLLGAKESLQMNTHLQ